MNLKIIWCDVMKCAHTNKIGSVAQHIFRLEEMTKKISVTCFKRWVCQRLVKGKEGISCTVMSVLEKFKNFRWRVQSANEYSTVVLEFR